MRVFVGLLYLLPLLGALAGAIELLTSMSPSASAPQVAAIAARAIAFAVIPYVLARAVEGMARPWPRSPDQVQSWPSAPTEPPAQESTQREPADPRARLMAGIARRHS